MNRLLVALVLAGLALAASGAAADYDAETRIATIGRTIDALGTAAGDRDKLEARLSSERGSRCQGGSIDLRLRCSLEVAAALCADRAEPDRRRCRLIVDVALTNQLGQSSFVTDSKRYSLMRGADDFRAALLVELRARYAELVTEMSVSRHYTRAADHETPALAASIDAFCVDRAHRSRLAWQRCVAAIVWYIGSTP